MTGGSILQRVALMTMLAATPAGADGLIGHGGPVMAIAAGPQGVATASFDNSVGVWTDDEPRWNDGHAAAVNTVIWLPDGRLASGGDDFDVIVWAEEARHLTGHRGKVMGLASSPDGRLVASASWDGTIGLWDIDGDAAPRFLEGHGAPVNAVAFRDDALLSAGADGTLREWSPDTGAVLRTVVSHGFGINRFVTGPGWIAYGALDGAVRVVDDDGIEIANLDAGRRPILAMALSPDGATMAVGDGEGYVMLVTVADWSVLRDFRATARGPVWAAAFDGDRLLTGGLSNDVVAWPTDGTGTALSDAAATPAFLTSPDDNGARQFARKCAICHTLTPGSARRAGPTLHGLFGRTAGSVADYAYSPTLDGSDMIWTPGAVDTLFDVGPAHFLPGTKMPMQRITSAGDRADLIAYLRRATAP